MGKWEGARQQRTGYFQRSEGRTKARLRVVLVVCLLALGLVSAAEAVDPSKPYINRIDTLVAFEREAVEISWSGGFVSWDAHLLSDPPRIVLEMEAQLSDEIARSVDGQLLTAVRAARVDGKTRVVLELSAPVGFEVMEKPGGGALLVLLQHLITGLSLQVGGGSSALQIEATASPRYTVCQLSSPDRLVIDLHDSSWYGGPMEKAVDSDYVSRLRVGQFTEKDVRVVVEGRLPLMADGLFDPRGGARLDLRLHKGFAGLGVDEDQFRSEFSILGGGALNAQLTECVDPPRLVVDVPGTFSANLKLPRELQGRVKQVRAAQYQPGVVRLVFDVPDGCRYSWYPGDDRSPSRLTIWHHEIAGKRILIDPGHGGADPGYVGAEGTLEKDVNLQTALYLAYYLRQAGAQVYLSRYDDRYVSNVLRPLGGFWVDDKIEYDVFVSIHHNAFATPEPSGTETYYQRLDYHSQRLANLVQAELLKELGLVDRGVKVADYIVLKHCPWPGILVEVAFLSNPVEEELVLSPGFPRRSAMAIMRGLVAYWEERGEVSPGDGTIVRVPAGRDKAELLLDEALAAAGIEIRRSTPVKMVRSEEEELYVCRIAPPLPVKRARAAAAETAEGGEEGETPELERFRDLLSWTLEDWGLESIEKESHQTDGHLPLGAIDRSDEGESDDSQSILPKRLVSPNGDTTTESQSKVRQPGTTGVPASGEREREGAAPAEPDEVGDTPSVAQLRPAGREFILSRLR